MFQLCCTSELEAAFLTHTTHCAVFTQMPHMRTPTVSYIYQSFKSILNLFQASTANLIPLLTISIIFLMTLFIGFLDSCLPFCFIDLFSQSCSYSAHLLLEVYYHHSHPNNIVNCRPVAHCSINTFIL